MKNVVVTYCHPDGRKTVYLDIDMEKRRKKNPSSYLHQIQHKLRIKGILFGCLFCVYNKEMDFTFAESKGWVKQ